MKTIAHFFLCVLLAISLVWGGCLPSTHHSCCNAAGHCGKAARDCQAQPMALGTDAPADHSDGSLTVAAPIAPAAVAALPAVPAPVVRTTIFSPPGDLLLLHSTLRI